MCCYTHEERDKRDLHYNHDETIKLFATAPELLCQCRFGGGMSCRRAMTQEDYFCDWCRDRRGNPVTYDNPITRESMDDWDYAGHYDECNDFDRSGWIDSTGRAEIHAEYRKLTRPLGRVSRTYGD